MTITLELPPEIEARLVAEARDRGLPVAEIIKAHLMQSHAPVSDTQSLSVKDRVREIDDFFAELDRDPPSGVAPLSDEALSRENLYDDRRNRL
jgi:hypothetical protein